MKYRALLLKIFLGASLVGLALASYSLAHKTGFASGAVCDLNATFNCDIVNRGPYSEIGNVPVALIGVIGYAFYALASFLKLREPHDRALSLFLLAGAGGGLLFTLYLSGIEAFVLHTFCIVCLSSQLVMIALFGLVLAVFLGERLASKAAQAKDIVRDAVQDLKEIR